MASVTSEAAAADLAKLFNASLPRGGHGTAMDPAQMDAAYSDAVASHPFVHQAHYHTTFNSNAIVRDGNGTVVCMLMKAVLPTTVTDAAAHVLRPAATRTSLRAGIFGGVSPLSGIAGYFDYAGSPIEYKCRKTSYTCDVVDHWEGVFPMVEYANDLYRTLRPDNWTAQNGAIPDVVRIRNTVFSTLTINQRFRTAQHTDAGDFDDGFGVITCIEGSFEGLNLGFPRLGVCVRLEPGDILLFNTHHWHANTEVERVGGAGTGLGPDWNRMTCVFYYRANLGAAACLREYQRRLDEAKRDKATYEKTVAATKKGASDEELRDARSVLEALAKFDALKPNNNGVNMNRPAIPVNPCASPLSAALAAVDTTARLGATPATLRALSLASKLVCSRTAFGDFRVDSEHFDALLEERDARLHDLRLVAIAADEVETLAGLPALAPNASAAERLYADGAVFGSMSDASRSVAIGSFVHELLFGEPSYSDIPAGIEAHRATHQKRRSAVNVAGPIWTAPHRFVAASVTASVMLNQACPTEGPRSASLAQGTSAVVGLEPRAEGELAAVNLDVLTSRMGGSKLGGFSESSTVLEHGAAHHGFLAPNTLRGIISEDLHKMWCEARDKWLSLVKRDWLKQFARNPAREDFSWANQGEMNTAFFDLCDVGLGIMQVLLEKDEPTPQEAGRFWLAFAYHLFDACVDENKMPATAMSMRKLNVKLKDHQFGGTRYFKDQTPEEQARRLARKDRIQQARRCGITLSKRGSARRTTTKGGSDSEGSSADDEDGAPNASWLDNDRFDYQSEDKAVEYSKTLPSPAGVCEAIRAWFAAHQSLVDAQAKPKASRSESAAAAAGGPLLEQCRVLVVRPEARDSACREACERYREALAAAVSADAGKGALAMHQLWRRLACDPDNARFLATWMQTTSPNHPLTTDVQSLENVIVAVGAELRASAREDDYRHVDISAVKAASPKDSKILKVLTDLLLQALSAAGAVAATPLAFEDKATWRRVVVDIAADGAAAQRLAVSELRGTMEAVRAALAAVQMTQPAAFDFAVVIDGAVHAPPRRDAKTETLYDAWRALITPVLCDGVVVDRHGQGAVFVVERDANDAHHFMLPDAIREACEAVTRPAVAIGVALSRRGPATHLPKCLPDVLPRQALEAASTLSSGCPATGEGGAAEMRPRLPGFLTLYQLPRSPHNTYVALLPPAPAAASPTAASSTRKSRKA